jgi:sphingolipid delta-4 desaturase
MPITRSKAQETGKPLAANNSTKTSTDFLDEKLTEFYWLHNEQPHAQRRLDMLKKYPEIKTLMKHEPITKYIILVEVAVQMFVAWYLTKHNMIWTWQFWILAYVLGGTITSSLVLSIHEVTHFLAFKDPKMNKILACIANLPIVLPFCVEFKVRR